MSAPVVVVGGGVSGLVAAYELERRGIDVVLLEAGDRVGGKILTTELDGATVELGPDSFLARDPILVDLCRELGLEDELVAPVGFGAQVWTADGLRRLPQSTYFGMPLDADDAAGILSPDGIAQVRAEATMPVAGLGDDVSVGDLVTQRFGDEVLQRMVDPILAGTRAGDPFEVSTRSALPEAWAALKEGVSITDALRRERGSQVAAPPPFFGLRSGMTRLVEAIAGALGDAEVRTSSQVISLLGVGDGYRVRVDDDELTASGVVLTVPPLAAAEMLASLDRHLAHGLGHFETADVAIATFSFPAELDLPEGSGLLVPSRRERTLTGATWYSRKWPHAAAPGRTIVRCFAGRSRDDRIPADDDSLVAALLDDLGAAIGQLPRPSTTEVARWPAGLPIYRVGHERRMRAIEKRLEEFPGLSVIGAAYRGSGLPDCARQATAAAERVAAGVGTRAR